MNENQEDDNIIALVKDSFLAQTVTQFTPTDNISDLVLASDS